MISTFDLNDANVFSMNRALEVSELRKEVSDQKETNTRLDRERETLLSKIEAGEGMDTALQQLKQQNVLVVFLDLRSCES